MQDIAATELDARIPKCSKLSVPNSCTIDCGAESAQVCNT